MEEMGCVLLTIFAPVVVVCVMLSLLCPRDAWKGKGDAVVMVLRDGNPQCHHYWLYEYRKMVSRGVPLQGTYFVYYTQGRGCKACGRTERILADLDCDQHDNSYRRRVARLMGDEATLAKMRLSTGYDP